LALLGGNRDPLEELAEGETTDANENADSVLSALQEVNNCLGKNRVKKSFGISTIRYPLGMHSSIDNL
jgi:hypothetical protein